MLAGAIFGGLCNTTGQLIGARVFLGIGTVLARESIALAVLIAEISATALVPELAHPRLRHMAGGFLNTVYFVSVCRLLPLTSGRLDLCLVVDFCHGLLSRSYVGLVLARPHPHARSRPDPPWRWRVVCAPIPPMAHQARTQRRGACHPREIPVSRIALHCPAHHSANGEMNDPLVLLEMREITANIELDRAAPTAGWSAFFKTAGNRRRFFVIILIGTATQWIGNGIVSYFLVAILKQVGITQSSQTAGINGGISIWSWFVAMTGASLSNKFGRRSLFLTSLVGALISFIMITALSGSYATTGNSATGVAMIPFLFLFNAAYALAFTPIPLLYTPEISPFALRAKSASLLPLAQNCAQSFNQVSHMVTLALRIVCQPRRTRGDRLEVLYRLRRHHFDLSRPLLVLCPRDQGLHG